MKWARRLGPMGSISGQKTPFRFATDEISFIRIGRHACILISVFLDYFALFFCVFV